MASKSRQLKTEGANNPMANPTMFTAARFVSPKAERQWREARKEAHLLAGELVRLCKTNTDWDYRPPGDDDPRTWVGLVRWCYVERCYVWLLDRAADLKLGGGPYHCEDHGQKAKAGWKPQPCLRCSWESYLYDDTLALARSLGRQRKRAA